MANHKKSCNTPPVLVNATDSAAKSPTWWKPLLEAASWVWNDKNIARQQKGNYQVQEKRRVAISDLLASRQNDLKNSEVIRYEQSMFPSKR